MPPMGGVHHLALTVRDVERSATFYRDLLGMVDLLAGDEDTVSYRVLLHQGSGLVLGVRQYRDGSADDFDELRTGLDHVAFGVPSREVLEEWSRALDAKGIPHDPVTDTPIGSVIVFRDPDNIQLELWYPSA